MPVAHAVDDPKTPEKSKGDVIIAHTHTHTHARTRTRTHARTFTNGGGSFIHKLVSKRSSLIEIQYTIY